MKYSLTDMYKVTFEGTLNPPTKAALQHLDYLCPIWTDQKVVNDNNTIRYSYVDM